VIGYIVCDNVDYFYDHVQAELSELGIDRNVRELIEFRDARGAGYSLSRPEEIALLKSVAQTSGVLLDGCYSGKALFGFVRDADLGHFENQKVMFIHTGGSLGIFAMPKDNIINQDQLHEF
jgi:1-aminocyclopropane-1-carboxylate deaminase/D-cysteine desulfhydrase-like pyridoxal-dependent ACC family enzyme